MAHTLTLIKNRFTPKEIPNLAIWLDAQDYSTLTFNSTTISQWRDKSGNANHASQGTAINQPKYVAQAINGWPSLQGFHDGSNRSLLSINDAPSLDFNAYTLCCVFSRVSNPGAEEPLVCKYNGTAEFRVGVNSGGYFY